MRQPLKICMEIDSYRQLLYGGSLLTKIKRYRQGFEMDVPVCIFFFHRKIYPVKEKASGRAHIVRRTMALCRPKRSVDCAARREEVCILRVGYTMTPYGKIRGTCTRRLLMRETGDNVLQWFVLWLCLFAINKIRLLIIGHASWTMILHRSNNINI